MAIAAGAPMRAEMAELKLRLKTMWTAGDYDVFSRYMELGTEQFVRRAGVMPGMRVLDVACGAGQISLIAARMGAEVTGCDIAANWVEQARRRAAAEGLRATFEEADVEMLPYRDGEFDLVATSFGAMFAPRPEMAAREMLRVCRPGGVVAMANWTAAGFIGQMFRTIAKYMAPPGMPSPLLWGEEAVVRERMTGGASRVDCERRMFPFDYPFGPEEVVEFFRVNYGPMTRAFLALDGAGREKLRGELVALWSAYNRGKAGETKVDAEYLEVVARRR